MIEFLVGAFALTAFALVAFGSGGPPTDDTWRRAFLIGGAVAIVEIGILLWRAQPANRLILGANIWLAAGSLAFLTRQWWLLDWYQRTGVAGLLGVVAVTGAIATVVSRRGFVGADGAAPRVLQASAVLLVATLVAVAITAARIGDIRATGAMSFFCLAWLNRGLRFWVRRSL